MFVPNCRPLFGISLKPDCICVFLRFLFECFPLFSHPFSQPCGIVFKHTFVNPGERQKAQRNFTFLCRTCRRAAVASVCHWVSLFTEWNSTVSTLEFPVRPVSRKSPFPPQTFPVKRVNFPQLVNPLPIFKIKMHFHCSPSSVSSSF